MGKFFSLIPRAMWEILEILLQGTDDVHHTYYMYLIKSTHINDIFLYFLKKSPLFNFHLEN